VANTLHVDVVSCHSLQARISGTDINAYVAFRLLDHQNSVTQTSIGKMMVSFILDYYCAGRQNPIFGEAFSFPMLMTTELDRVLKDAVVEFFVIDDNDPGVCC
jgi:hypothetical protein